MRASDSKFERHQQVDAASLGSAQAVGTVAQTVPPAPAGPRRGRQLLSWITTAALSRAVSALVPLALIPVTLSYLGAELYGLWTAVIAVTAMMAFADLGIGLGLMTRLAPLRVNDDVDAARRYISSAYAVVSAAALFLCGLLWLLAGAIPWALVFNVPEPTARDGQMVALVCLTAALLNIPLYLVYRIQYAHHQVVASNVWQAVASVASLLLALGAVLAGLPPIAVIAAVAVCPPLVNVVNTVWTFGWRLPQLTPRLRYVEQRRVRDLLHLGGMFFLTTLVMTLADNADPLIIAQVLGLASVTAYAVPAKLLTQLGPLVMLVNQPLWPMYGEALARGDVTWIRRTVRRMTVISVLIALLPATFLVLLGDRLFAAWLPVPVGSRALLLGLACWWITIAAISPRFIVQNAAGVLRPQLLGYSLYLPLSVLGKLYAVHRFGISATPYVGVITYAATVAPAAVYGYRRVLAAQAVAAGGGGLGRPRLRDSHVR
ncbi:oligosaccharide flippase family protein [Micromonospora sp. Llam7]|uniref:lipopolysaccharide biosynthesis protein n=1 Tax=Micromonospora tarapacensis TaxID=2835305 RepID=UPI001C83572B|nr:oligosaccharide flippase family protein [Micromonospora tarapacensis]MBX7268043.1 oligosaccharide flippase family protein [Micromonospora tarapacensis]